MDSMISSAARAKSELIEAKQQINVLESHSRRFASERESLYSQIEVLKVNICSAGYWPNTLGFEDNLIIIWYN